MNSKSLQVVESERFDDDTSECSKDTVRSDSCENNSCVQPCNWIEESFDDVRPFNMMIGDAGVIFTNSFEGDVSLSVVEDFCSSWIVRKEDKHENSPSDRTCSGKQVNVLPSTVSKVE